MQPNNAMPAAIPPIDGQVDGSNELVQMLGSRLHALASERIRQRQPIEERWLEDLQQYLGQYDAETLAELNKDKSRSKVFVNITRPKTNSAESRFGEMLFPSDDLNWGIDPTPVPEMSLSVYNNSPIVDESGKAVLGADGKQMTVGDQAKSIMDEARKRAKLMQDEINDQLSEADYNAKARDAIHDACVFGTGILKGPIVVNRTHKVWSEIPGTNVYQLSVENDLRPGVEKVDVWDFFPDMSARDIDESDSTLQRKFVTRKQLRALAKNPRLGYLIPKIREILKSDPRTNVIGSTTHVSKLRELSGQAVNLTDNRYEMWEYRGPISKDDLRAAGVEVSDDEIEEYDGIVLFIGSTVIKADINPMDTEESPYSVFIYERDDTSIFGYGVCYLLRHIQRMINGAIRTMLENAGLSSGPQIVVNREIIEPADGVWTLSAKKIWFLKDANARPSDAWYAFEINSHQAELERIFALARDLADDTTGLPMLAQGDQGDAPDTATGMSMLMNNANTMLRRAVKQWDDNVTRTLIGRFYDWNMQYSSKAEIKGDYSVDARGSSTLLVKETQTAGLLKTMEFASSEVWRPLTKMASLYRKVVESQRINPADVVKTDEEIETDQAQGAESQQQQQQLLQAQLEKIKEEINEIRSRATAKSIDAIYSAMQAGAVIAQNPSVAGLGDELLGSGGFVDHNAAPIVTPPSQASAPIDMPTNTSPAFPARAASPDAGMMSGSETLALSDNV